MSQMSQSVTRHLTFRDFNFDKKSVGYNQLYFECNTNLARLSILIGYNGHKEYEL